MEDHRSKRMEDQMFAIHLMGSLCERRVVGLEKIGKAEGTGNGNMAQLSS
jgi:hypothetical protein